MWGISNQGALGCLSRQDVGQKKRRGLACVATERELVLSQVTGRHE